MLALALGLDLLMGEPPVGLHPVVWIGKVISFLEQRSPSEGPVKQYAYGLCSLTLVAGFSGALAVVVLLVSRYGNAIIYLIISALLLKATFSMKMLFRAVSAVSTSLRSGDLATARLNLMSLVSRDTSQLDESLIAAAAIESVAENSSDSIVAPIFYFALFGVPGAVVYRVINTFDSMWGYHGRYEYLGKAAARLDDVVNLIPARLSALFLVLVAALTGRGGRSWGTLQKYRKETESPNAGWTMSATAGALGVQLEKTGYYKLGDPHESLGREKIGEAIGLVQGALLVAILFLAGLMFILSSFFPRL